MLLASNLEEELVGALLGEVGDFGLVYLLVEYSSFRSFVESYQVEDASGGGLVLGALGQEKQTLAGLAGPGSSRVGDSGLLVLVEDRELLGLNGLIVEVEETLGEAQAPMRETDISRKILICPVA